MKQIIFSAALCALLLCACGGQKDTDTGVRYVETVAPEPVTASGEKHFSGTVKEAAQVSVAFKTAGQLEQVLVKEGSHVSAGQLIATLDDSDYLLGLRAAESQHRQLRDEVERLRRLHEAQALSGNDYEKALSGLEQVEVNLQVYQNKVKYTKLYAPAAGYVEKVNFERSEMVDAGTPVISLLADGCKEVEVALPLRLYSQREQMGRCTATIGGRSYGLRLLSIVPKADNTQLYRATFAIEGAGQEVSAGMNAAVSIRLADDGGSEELQLPLRAVFQHEGKSCVWVVADGTVHRTAVQTGSVTADGRIAISSGLKGGERIVKAGVSLLHEGDRVRVANEQSETNVGGVL